MVSLKEMVTGDKKVKFVFYRDKALHYETEDGFIFPVPIGRDGFRDLSCRRKGDVDDALYTKSSQSHANGQTNTKYLLVLFYCVAQCCATPFLIASVV